MSKSLATVFLTWLGVLVSVGCTNPALVGTLTDASTATCNTVDSGTNSQIDAEADALRDAASEADVSHDAPGDSSDVSDAHDGSLPPSCSDGLMNNGETATDCGGGTCAPCPDSAACSQARDCLSDRCDGSHCSPLFEPAVAVPAGNEPRWIASGDFNGDHNVDLAVAAHEGSSTGAAMILLGNGDGTFLPAARFQTHTGSFAVATADFNGDHFLDLALANSGANDASILLGRGDGTFQAAINFPCGIFPFSVTTADYNRDGQIDVAVSNGTTNDVSILIGDGTGSFRAAVSNGVGSGPTTIVSTDLDGDGVLDILTANYPSDSIGYLRGRGDGTFLAVQSILTGDGPYSLVANDFNGDGRTDVATSDYNGGAATVVLAGPSGQFSIAGSYVETQAVADSIVSGDFVGDHNLDLAVTDYATSDIRIFRGNGDGTFQPALSYPCGHAPRNIATADLNGDGLLDIIVANFNSDTVNVLLHAP